MATLSRSKYSNIPQLQSSNAPSRNFSDRKGSLDSQLASLSAYSVYGSLGYDSNRLMNRRESQGSISSDISYQSMPEWSSTRDLPQLSAYSRNGRLRSDPERYSLGSGVVRDVNLTAYPTSMDLSKSKYANQDYDWSKLSMRSRRSLLETRKNSIGGDNGSGNMNGRSYTREKDFLPPIGSIGDSSRSVTPPSRFDVTPPSRKRDGKQFVAMPTTSRMDFLEQALAHVDQSQQQSQSRTPSRYSSSSYQTTPSSRDTSIGASYSRNMSTSRASITPPSRYYSTLDSETSPSPSPTPQPTHYFRAVPVARNLSPRDSPPSRNILKPTVDDRTNQADGSWNSHDKRFDTKVTERLMKVWNAGDFYPSLETVGLLVRDTRLTHLQVRNW